MPAFSPEAGIFYCEWLETFNKTLTCSSRALKTRLIR
jgi:hypothetical protein